MIQTDPTKVINKTFRREIELRENPEEESMPSPDRPHKRRGKKLRPTIEQDEYKVPTFDDFLKSDLY